MNRHRVTEEELLSYICGEMDETRGQAIRCALEDSPELAAQAAELLIAVGSLQGAIDGEDIAFVKGEPRAHSQGSVDTDGAGTFKQTLRQSLADAKERDSDQGDIPADSDDSRAGRVAFNVRLRTKWKEHLAAESPHGRTGRLWTRLLPASAAACLGIGLLIWLLLFPSASATVYAITDMHQRIEQLDSIYLSGRQWRNWGTQDVWENPVESTFEEYMERPNYYWKKSTDPIFSSLYVTDGYRYISIDDDEKRCRYGNEYPLGSTLKRASIFSSTLKNILVGDPRKEYEYLRTEELDGQTVDVYQQSVKLDKVQSKRIVIWFNPATGYPVRTNYYFTNWTKKEILAYEFICIKPNVSMPLDPSVFELPEGYEHHRKDRDETNFIFGNSIAGNPEGKVREDGVIKTEGTTRFYLSIDDRALLMCWSLRRIKEDGYLEPKLDDPTGSVLKIRAVVSNKNRVVDCYHNVFALVPVSDRHWRWSLIMPKDPTVPINGNTFSMSSQTPRPGVTLGGFAFSVSDDIVNQVLTAPHGPTHPDGQPMTVDDIRVIIDTLEKSTENVQPVVQ